VSDALLEVEHVTKHFPITHGIVFKREAGAVRALDDVSLTVRRGETLGKTTIAKKERNSRAASK
jgi:ABC-type oligopeptide transport system ATPase subunit